MNFLDQLAVRAARLGTRIVFPEAADPRIREAALRLARAGILTPVFVLDPADPASHEVARATGLECVDPAGDDVRMGELAVTLAGLHAKPGLHARDAVAHSHDPLVFATYLLRLGVVDGLVAGAVRTTADVIRAALWLIDPLPGVRTVSSAFYMCVPPFRDAEGRDGEEEILTFTDCAVVRRLTAERLADIALAAAEARRRIVGDEPRVALLSYGTRGSGGDAGSVVVVREALALIRARDPALAVDGELQADAALMASVGARKAPDSPVSGRANVLVFPSLEAGNIAYKLTERLARATAIGPILQGLARPVSDLSRGADTDAIFHVAAITALQVRAVPRAPAERHSSLERPGDQDP